uniref:Chromosome 1 C19orf47 homolog n=1 Tax=Canis lupus familiaris TaxID=9615 RepID=A0A8P0PKC9_CANLF
MVSVTMATSEWIQFFKEAGIPPGPAVNYAVMFVDNRIQKSMLLDLNKEIMNELGVTVVGDIIAILKHAKVVHRQDMCKAATESVPCSPSPLPGEIRRGASSAASRMIANSLNRDSPPGTPPRRPDTSTSKISVTVSNKMAAKSAKTAAALARREEESLAVPTKRRRVTAEMEGKYIINMPKGTTPRTRKILEQQQAAKGLQRTSVFDRLGAETKADTTTGNKPTGVFSRLGATPEMDEDLAWDSDNDSSSSVLQYAGVLKKLGRGPAKPSPQPALTVKAKKGWALFLEVRTPRGHIFGAGPKEGNDGHGHCAVGLPLLSPSCSGSVTVSSPSVCLTCFCHSAYWWLSKRQAPL